MEADELPRSIVAEEVDRDEPSPIISALIYPP